MITLFIMIVIVNKNWLVNCNPIEDFWKIYTSVYNTIQSFVNMWTREKPTSETLIRLRL